MHLKQWFITLIKVYVRKTGWQNSKENQQIKLEEGNNKAKTRNQYNKKQTYSKRNEQS